MSMSAVLPASIYLLLGAVPARWANRYSAAYGTVVRFGSAGALFVAAAAVVLMSAAHLSPSAETGLLPVLPVNVGVFGDGLTAAMLLLIGGLGLVVVQFSRRYLDGDPQQGRFLKWLCVTVGAALWLVVARDLVVLTFAWMLSSWGLHHLLIHYPERSWAVWAARKKFVISRCGDLLLLSALLLCYFYAGSTDLDVLFRAAETSATATEGVVPWQVIGWLLVLGAMTKSAQVPFHSWLPDTMETPTPVSALMHAGIINAGGFLVLRLSPVIEQAPGALAFLALGGLLTALLGSVSMLTQSSIKRSLAYSTIAQMGFMMLQCGLGAYSAALLHLVAHSVYKSHAFLRSGSAATNSPVRFNTPRRRLDRRQLPFALLIAASVVGWSAWLTGFDMMAKAGGPALSLILTLALTQLVWQALASRSTRVLARTVLMAVLVALGYFVGVAAMQLLHPGRELTTHAPRSLEFIVMAIITAAFLGLFVLQTQLAGACGKWLQALHVHAMHGFYLDIPARRITARMWGLKTPVP